MGGILALVAGCFVASSVSAPAQPRVENLPGRWVHDAPRCTGTTCRQTYDFGPCGNAWCGIEVKEGNVCGRLAFRLTQDQNHNFGVEFTGRFERTPGAETYAVQASLRVPSALDSRPENATLVVVGNTGETVQLYRRTFPLHMVLRRDGEPTCKADPKLS